MATDRPGFPAHPEFRQAEDYTSDKPVLQHRLVMEYARACYDAGQAATLATVTPLVQMLVSALEDADADSQEVLANYQQIYSERYKAHRLHSQEEAIAANAQALTAARAFLSGATKESTDHG